MPNRLADTTSPYLLQHAHNPVDWYPWGPEALERARAEDRPILLSIGYSACHWCHVMERESFEDPATAELMNTRFVSIKVDREERPDVDQVYMRAVQALTGGGGWPLTVFLTPELRPYHGGTYYPPEPRHGMPSFRQVLAGAADAYAHRREDVAAAAARLVGALAEAARTSPDGPEAGQTLLDAAVRSLRGRYDAVHGGFGRAPKFPQPTTLETLLRAHARTGAAEPREEAVHTLRAMAAGGLRDHLGGGFHRYSVDARWLVPHFEKMLYDNALLARVYLDAWRLTGEADLREVAEQTLDWMLSDLRHPEGGFYSARDADSEGEEGVFYVWTPDQIETVLGAGADRFMRTYDVTGGGNFEGRSILNLPHPLDAAARHEDAEPAAFRQEMASARVKLLEARAAREAPFRDEKVLTGWSAMAVRTLAEAGGALDRADYLEAAVAGADFLLDVMRPEGRLMHVFKDGVVHVPGFLEDHAALGNALLSLHAATLAPRWLAPARQMADEVWTRFRDPTTGTLYDTADDAEALIVRPRDPTDGATPSGPSLAAELLARAGALFDEPEWVEGARAAVAAEADAVARHPAAFGRLLAVLDNLVRDPLEVVVVGGSEDPERAELLGAVSRRYLPHALVTGFDPAEAGAGGAARPAAVGGAASPPTAAGGGAASPPAAWEGRTLVDGRPAAYVCRRFACDAPVTSPGELAAALDARAAD